MRRALVMLSLCCCTTATGGYRGTAADLPRGKGDATYAESLQGAAAVLVLAAGFDVLMCLAACGDQEDCLCSDRPIAPPPGPAEVTAEQADKAGALLSLIEVVAETESATQGPAASPALTSELDDSAAAAELAELIEALSEGTVLQMGLADLTSELDEADLVDGTMPPGVQLIHSTNPTAPSWWLTPVAVHLRIEEGPVGLVDITAPAWRLARGEGASVVLIRAEEIQLAKGKGLFKTAKDLAAKINTKLGLTDRGARKKAVDSIRKMTQGKVYATENNRGRRAFVPVGKNPPSGHATAYTAPQVQRNAEGARAMYLMMKKVGGDAGATAAARKILPAMMKGNMPK